MSLLLILAVGIGFMWLMSRPQRKAMKEQQQQLAAVQPGDRVLLQSGVYCTVREVGDRQLIVEYAPGVDVPVLKHVMVRKVNDGEEEFQFDDQLESVNDFEFDPAIDPELTTGSEEFSFGESEDTPGNNPVIDSETVEITETEEK